MLQSIPFLLFDGDCAEAMTFYHQCLGGNLSVTKVGNSPMKDMFPHEKHDRTINAVLKSKAVEISASDWMASPHYKPIRGNMSAIFIVGTVYEELKAVFDQLAEGAGKDRFQDLHPMPFGTYGQFYDRYGVQWIFKGDVRV